MLVKLLNPFKTVSVMGQERGIDHGAIGTVLVKYDILLGKLENERQKVRIEDTDYTARIEKAWEKLTHYYNLTNNTPVYCAATILDPRIKMKYFTRKWEANQLETARQYIQNIYMSYYTPEEDIASANDNTDDDDDELDLDEWQFGKNEPRKDELQRYLSAAVLPRRDLDLLDWWRCNEPEYPTLTKIAFNILCIPAMSVEPERVFSGYLPMLV
jgi:hAT family C-terminal dimerisation region/Domain of unknown function (DUF4413)